MITQFELSNFGPLQHIQAHKLGKINLIIGANSCGKTFLLKALYCAVRTMEETGLGDDPRSQFDVLHDKLFWTFQSRTPELVRQGVTQGLRVSLKEDDVGFSFSFTEENDVPKYSFDLDFKHRNATSLFFPPKEILSFAKTINKSRNMDKVFGFDDTYLDLLNALRNPVSQESNGVLPEIQLKLAQVFEGRLAYDEDSDHWSYKKNGQSFSIFNTAEGIKKIGIVERLLENKTLRPGSIVFIDEPESALHPKAITAFLDIVEILAKHGIQFFIASHSYFVIKKLYLLAQKNQLDIPVLVNDNGSWQQSSLLDGMPDNEIINESIRIYQEEIGLVMD